MVSSVYSLSFWVISMVVQSQGNRCYCYLFPRPNDLVFVAKANISLSVAIVGPKYGLVTVCRTMSRNTHTLIFFEMQADLRSEIQLMSDLK